MKKILVLLILLSLFLNVYSASTLYWLRGTDVKVVFVGGEGYFMTGSSPGPTSTETIITADLGSSPKEVGKWYSTSFPVDFTISGNALFWSTNLTSTSTTAKYRVVLYEFDSALQSKSKIIEGEWFPFSSGESEITISIEKPYTIKPKNRLLVVLEAVDESSESELEFIIDRPTPFGMLEWNASNGERYEAFGSVSSAAIAMIACSFSSVACLNNQQCSDGNTFTLDTCVNPGECSSYCNYDVCAPNCVSHAECDDQDPKTSDVCLGINSCYASCSNALCEVSCNSNADCDDGVASTSDECVLASTCNSFCSNTGCAGDECSFQRNVCGNGLCEEGEDCSEDCSDKKVVMVSPLQGGTFLRGDQIIVKVRAEGYFFVAPKIVTTGDFGENQLFDDGEHFDGESNDLVYAGEINVPSNAKEGYNKVIFEATREDEKIDLVKYFIVAPFLDVDLNFVPEILVGDELKVRVTVLRNYEPFEGGIQIKVNSPEGTIIDKTVFTNELGFYDFIYFPSSFDSGEWVVNVSVEDSSSNYGGNSSTIQVLSPSRINLEFTLLKGFELAVHKNSSERIEVSVNISEGDAFIGGLVELVLPTGEIVRLNEEEEGVYSNTVIISKDTPTGLQNFLLKARRISEEEVIAGSKNIGVNIVEGLITVNTNGLKESYSVGDNLLFSFKTNYDDGTIVDDVKVEVFFDDVSLGVIKIGEGEFGVNHDLSTLEEGDKTLFIRVETINGGYSILEKKISINGVSVLYYLKNYYLYILILILVVLLGSYLSIKMTKHGLDVKKLEDREKELTKEIGIIQERYFNKGLISRKKYDELMLKYQYELNNIRGKLKGGKK